MEAEMFKIGNYVNWMEDYADGFAGRDWGDGIIIDTQFYESSFHTEPILTYKVYRNEHKDFCWFEKRNLKLKGETNE